MVECKVLPTIAETFSATATRHQDRLIFVPMSLFHAKQVQAAFMNQYAKLDTFYRSLDAEMNDLEPVFNRVMPRCLKDECSYVAVDWQSNKVVACIVSVIRRRTDADDTNIWRRYSLCLRQPSPKLKAVCDFFGRFARPQGEFEKFPDADSFLEIVFLYVHPDYALHGIQTNLLAMTIEAARRKHVDYVTHIATNLHVQACCLRSGFQTLHILDYSEYRPVNCRLHIAPNSIDYNDNDDTRMAIEECERATARWLALKL